MADLNIAEKALVKETQEALGAAKDALREIAGNMRRLAKINRDAGRAMPANAAMRLEGRATEIRGALIAAHADASDSLAEAYDDGGIMVFGGGGGRR
ncbi:MAG: hypothetical protein WBB85_02045 [Albidovulum sp.]|uniref:hypothetical protein n=1 Tax=Albidovulum sp. TaxID=1872424 RepID=UPI003CB8C305